MVSLDKIDARENFLWLRLPTDAVRADMAILPNDKFAISVKDKIVGVKGGAITLRNSGAKLVTKIIVDKNFVDVKEGIVTMLLLILNLKFMRSIKEKWLV